MNAACIAVALFGLYQLAQANVRELNWVAGGDHAPYHTRKRWLVQKDAGIDLGYLQGKGWMVAQAAGAGARPGLADMSTISRSAKAPMKSQ